MSCQYCTPDKKGRRKSLSVNQYQLKGHSPDRQKIEVLKIYRKRNSKHGYFIGIKSKDRLSNGVMLRNNGFTHRTNINFCPMCGKKLSAKKVCATNTDK